MTTGHLHIEVFLLPNKARILFVHLIFNSKTKIENFCFSIVFFLYNVVKYFESNFEDGSVLTFEFSFCFIKSCFCPRTVFLF